MKTRILSLLLCLLLCVPVLSHADSVSSLVTEILDNAQTLNASCRSSDQQLAVAASSLCDLLSLMTRANHAPQEICELSDNALDELAEYAPKCKTARQQFHNGLYGMTEQLLIQAFYADRQAAHASELGLMCIMPEDRLSTDENTFCGRIFGLTLILARCDLQDEAALSLVDEIENDMYRLLLEEHIDDAHASAAYIYHAVDVMHLLMLSQGNGHYYAEEADDVLNTLQENDRRCLTVRHQMVNAFFRLTEMTALYIFSAT